MAVSAVKKEAAASEGDEAASAPKKKGFNWKLPVIGLCVIAAAGGGAYYALSVRSHGDAKETKAVAEKPPQFMPLDPFTVNLQLEDNPQFLQVALTLKVADAEAIEKIKLYVPEVRDKVLMLLSGQKASTLLTLEGKRALASDILNTINGIVAPEPKKRSAPPKKAAENEEEAQAAPETEKKAEGEPEDEEDGEVKPKKRASSSPPRSERPVLGVLFTSFIIQ